MLPKNYQFFWMARNGLRTRCPLVITVETAPSIHRAVHRRLHLRRRHPTGHQSQLVIRTARSLPIRCVNRLGQNQCVIRPSRSIPIPCENRLGQSRCVIRPTVAGNSVLQTSWPANRSHTALMAASW